MWITLHGEFLDPFLRHSEVFWCVLQRTHLLLFWEKLTDLCSLFSSCFTTLSHSLEAHALLLETSTVAGGWRSTLCKPSINSQLVWDPNWPLVGLQEHLLLSGTSKMDVCFYKLSQLWRIWTLRLNPGNSEGTSRRRMPPCDTVWACDADDGFAARAMLRGRLALASVYLCFVCLVTLTLQPAARPCTLDTIRSVEVLIDKAPELVWVQGRRFVLKSGEGIGAQINKKHF